MRARMERLDGENSALKAENVNLKFALNNCKEEFKAIHDALNDDRCDLSLTMAEIIKELKAELGRVKQEAVENLMLYLNATESKEPLVCGELKAQDKDGRSELHGSFANYGELK